MCLWCVCSRALKSSQHSLCSLLIVDTPGLQNPRLAKRECSATFEDLCHNYTQERLHTLFYQRTFIQELERYKEVRLLSFMRHAYIWPHCLFLPPTSFSLSLHLLLSLTQINFNSVCVHISDTHSSHLSQAMTSRVHALDLLISNASLHLFCWDQSKVTRNCLWETRPAAQQWCFSLMNELFFFCPPLISV